MYQPYVHTESILIFHTTMVEEELQRHRPERDLRHREARRHGPLVAVRLVAVRELIALGTRLDLATEPAHERAGWVHEPRTQTDYRLRRHQPDRPWRPEETTP